MKISYNWLKDYLNVDYPADKVAALLTDTGLEVEGIEEVESIKGGLKGVFVGEVISKTQHENADRLNVTQVNIGGEENLQIVCGAPNVEAGQKVIVATVGTTLFPNPEEPFPIKKAKIRGVESYGMICAEDELGLGNSHEGILVLPNNAKIGTAGAEYFNLNNDIVFEIGLTPNRTDAMGHVGAARDLKAALNVLENENLTLSSPSIFEKEIGNSKAVKIKLVDTESCPYYSGAIIKNITNLDSPEWIKDRLAAVGQKSINALVDITNYVMLETGQPLHAFDLDKVGSEIIVRKAKPNEPFKTLDEVDRKLNEQDLMICNADKPMCMAGVFGGFDSGVKDSTSSIFLEGAYFNPVSIRKTAKRHTLSTDSSFRFERGVDPQKVDFALRRAIHLILEISGGEVEGINSCGTIPEPLRVEFNFDRCRRVIGENLTDERISKILNELEFKVITDSEESWVLEVPSYRVDVTREIDIIEEVLRIHGFNNVPIPEKLNASLSNRPNPDKEKIYNLTADYLVSNGFFEIMNNSLTAYENEETAVALLNPLSIELKHMRTEMLSGGLKTIVHNQNRQYPNLKTFEFGKVYAFIDGKYIETEKLAIWLTGSFEEENWNNDSSKIDLYNAKGIADGICERLGIKGVKYSSDAGSFLIKSGKMIIGSISLTSAKVNKEYGIKNEVVYIDFNWKDLVTLSARYTTKAKTIPKTQFIRRDFSLLLDEAIQFDQIKKIANSVNNNLLQNVGLFDVFEGKKLPDGKKSYAVSFIFQDQDKTLKDELIDGIMAKIREKLETELKADLR